MNHKNTIDWTDVLEADICLDCYKAMNPAFGSFRRLHPKCIKRFFYEAYERDLPRVEKVRGGHTSQVIDGSSNL